MQSVEEALACDPVPIHTTQIGKDQMAYVEYFLDKTACPGYRRSANKDCSARI